MWASFACHKPSRGGFIWIFKSGWGEAMLATFGYMEAGTVVVYLAGREVTLEYPAIELYWQDVARPQVPWLG